MVKKILVVDDSALMRRMLSDIIESDQRFHVEAIAANGLDALDLIVKDPKRFDSVILDINMPKMNGIEFLKELEHLPIRLKVIVVSTVAKEGAKETIRCLELGAFDFVTKPDSFIEAKGAGFRQRILSCLCIANQFEHKEESGEPSPHVKKEEVKSESVSPMVRISTLKAKKRAHKPVGSNAKKLIALACSTGGPKALQEVIPLLPMNIDAPMIVIQHMPEGFTASLAQRLNELSNITVKEAQDGEVLQNGCCYLAKGGNQMRVRQEGTKYVLSLTLEAARNGLKPCADILFESLAATDFDDITCVVLTGMGADGTMGINQLNDTRNIYVIAQDEPTSTVYGMPKTVYEAGLCNEVVAISQVAGSIIRNVGVK